MPGIGGQRPPNVDWLVREIELLKAQVRELSAARSLPASNFKGGRFRFQDDDGNPRLDLGNVALVGGSQAPTSAYGIFGRGDDQGIVVMLREGNRGLVSPLCPIPLHPPSTTAVTSATFIPVVESVVSFPAHEVVRVAAAVQVAAGTVGEVRLFDGFSGQATDPLTLPASTNATASFAWLHPASVGLYDQHAHSAAALFLSVQARRVSGAGNVTVFWPHTAELSSRFLVPEAATDGTPRLG